MMAQLCRAIEAPKADTRPRSTPAGFDLRRTPLTPSSADSSRRMGLRGERAGGETTATRPRPVPRARARGGSRRRRRPPAEDPASPPPVPRPRGRGRWGAGPATRPAVVAEVGVAQLGVAVEAQLDDDRPVERGREEVGEHVGAGLGRQQRAHPLGAREQVVAVGAGQPGHVQPRADLVERAVGAAIGVAHRHPPVAQTQRRHLPLDLGGDPLRPVVQQRRQRVHVDGPAAPVGDVGDVPRDRPTGDDGDPVRRGRRAGRRTGR